MGFFDKAKEKPITKELPGFVDVHDIFKYNGEYYQKHRDYGYFRRERIPEFDKLNRHRCSSTCDKEFYENLDVSKIQELTVDDYKKLANERWFLRSEAMSQMCCDQIKNCLAYTFDIESKCIGGVSFIKRKGNDYDHTSEILTIHNGEVVDVNMDFSSYHLSWGNPASLAYPLYKAIDKIIGWDNFIDGIYAGNIISEVDVTNLNIKDALDRWYVTKLKKTESTLENTLEELYTYQRKLNAILEEKEISTTRHISTYKDMIMFINSIQLYTNILEPKFNVSMLKEAKHQSQLTDWIEKE